MKAPNDDLLQILKKELNLTIIKRNYNLLSPDVLCLSQKLDQLMNPLFKEQLESAKLMQSYMLQ